MSNDDNDDVAVAVTICTFRGWVHGCKSEAQPGSQLCYWHSNEPKTRERLEVERAAGRTDFCGADFRGSDFHNYPFCGQFSDRPFSGMKLVEADFSKANLADADFTGCDLWRAKFFGAYLRGARFTLTQLMESRFDGSDLTGAVFDRAFLRSSNFCNASMEGVSLKDSHFHNTSFEGCKWEVDKKNIYEGPDFGVAQEIYRKLKHAYSEFGDSVTAGEFFYREQECKRKSAQGWARAAQTLLWLFWGYGERPFRVLFTILFLSVVSSTVLHLNHGLAGGSTWDSIYYSLISFTALGYGSWVKDPVEWARFLGVVDTILGIVLVAFFVSSVVRKFSRL